MKFEEYEKINHYMRASLERNVNQKLTPELATGIMGVIIEQVSKMIEPEPEDGKPERTNIDTE